MQTFSLRRPPSLFGFVTLLVLLLGALPLASQDFPTGVNTDKTTGTVIYDYKPSLPQGSKWVTATAGPFVEVPFQQLPDQLDFSFQFDATNLLGPALSGLDITCLAPGGCPVIGIFGQVELSNVAEPLFAGLTLDGSSSGPVQGEFGLFDPDYFPVATAPFAGNPSFAAGPLNLTITPEGDNTLIITSGILFTGLAQGQMVTMAKSLDIHLSSVPEPATTVFVLVGLAVIMAARKRQGRGERVRGSGDLGD